MVAQSDIHKLSIVISQLSIVNVIRVLVVNFF